MADTNATEQSTQRRERRYYVPMPINAGAPGVTWARHSRRTDEYRGTAEALAAAGLLELERFPGMPGQNAVSAAYRPLGVLPEAGERHQTFPAFRWYIALRLGGIGSCAMSIAKK
ncbi:MULTISPECIES: hypothetical protein [unclassified Methylibium]|uniref:hypothetical protein n=1 Tax=unclassified Methylibium TaxID=2633235 RepID=UPI0003F472A0|nr:MULTISPECIES: hypothetical protein [unclassified Methylibium]EWS55729.1 hypothetical protein X551_01475 [Methylibium sp. T29]EWS59729.1 hypothetical protein Y694_02437 [Methylibium sp. T29-B]